MPSALHVLVLVCWLVGRKLQPDARLYLIPAPQCAYPFICCDVQGDVIVRWDFASAVLRVRLDLAIVQASVIMFDQPPTDWRTITSVLDLVRDVPASEDDDDYDDGYSSGTPSLQAEMSEMLCACCCWVDISREVLNGRA
jgi:hypothetical protein